MPMTDEQQQIRELARDFARSELRPGVEAWDRERRFPAEVVAQLAELGFFGMTLPEAEGGMGFELPAFVAALEELAWGEPVAALAVAHNAMALEILRRHGSDAQRAAWLEPLAAGAALAALALAGTDSDEGPAQVPVRAARRDGGWTLDGEARWVSNGTAAQVALVLARTDDSDGLGLFLVPTGSEGYAAGERYRTMGLRALEIVPVRLDGVRLDDGALVGPADGGLGLVQEAVVLGRLAVAAIAVGIAQAGLEHALRYSGERQQFGRPIRDFQAIQFKLADMATRTAAARALVLHAAGAPDPRTAAAAKLFAATVAMNVSTEAVQVYGGYGYMRDYPVEKLMRDAKATELLEGTNDALRVTIAGELFRS